MATISRSRRLLLGLTSAAFIAVAGFPATVSAQTAATLYERAQDREASARKAAPPALAALRSAAKSYEAIVARYPTSGYCDNALWQAAGLLTLAFERSGDADDRKAAERYLNWLRKEYPTSALAKDVPAKLDALADAAPAPAPSAPAASTSTAETQTPGRGATIRTITHTSLPRGDRLTIELSKEVAFTGDRIDGPDRVFFDFANAAPSDAVKSQPGHVAGALVSGVRLGRQANGATRVVLELKGAPRYSTFPLYDPFRLVIDIESDTLPERPVPVAPGPAAPQATTPVPQAVPANASATVPPPPEKPADGPAARAAETPADKPAASPPPPAPAPPSATSRGAYSLSRQLGLGVSRIVIDAGHGGHDPGARANGINESELVLDVALRVQKLLEEHPGVEVVLTRSDDRFIPLEERTAIANREGADLFLSIHANASRTLATRGVETYILNFASNPQAEAVAARENATSTKAMGTLPDLIKAITLNNKLQESRELATMVQTALVRSLRAKSTAVRDLGVKQAPFVVLIGAQMPSVLAEISFITNRAEATLLKQSSYRERIAQALADAVLKYQASLKKITTVAVRDEAR